MVSAPLFLITALSVSFCIRRVHWCSGEGGEDRLWGWGKAADRFKTTRQTNAGGKLQARLGVEGDGGLRGNGLVVVCVGFEGVGGFHFAWLSTFACIETIPENGTQPEDSPFQEEARVAPPKNNGQRLPFKNSTPLPRSPRHASPACARGVLTLPSGGPSAVGAHPRTTLTFQRRGAGRVSSPNSPRAASDPWDRGVKSQGERGCLLNDTGQGAENFPLALHRSGPFSPW